jgi:hypothetical protein
MRILYADKNVTADFDRKVVTVKLVNSVGGQISSYTEEDEERHIY